MIKQQTIKQPVQTEPEVEELKQQNQKLTIKHELGESYKLRKTLKKLSYSILVCLIHLMNLALK